jgi:hypothetical protein
MAIATFDAAAAGARPLIPFAKTNSGTLATGRPYSYFRTAGAPAAGTPATTLAGATLGSGNVGCLPRGDPASGEARVLQLVAALSAQSGLLYLVDRLWHNGGITITQTTAHTVNSVAWPARCPVSATDDTPSSGGRGVLIGVEVSSATGAGTPTLTIGYTNDSNVSGRTATNTVGTAATSAVGAFYPIGLQAGDNGVRSIQTFTLSATWTSGTINLVAYRIIAALPIGPGNRLDWLTGGAQRVYDNSHLGFILVPSATTSTALTGAYIETHG